MFTLSMMLPTLSICCIDSMCFRRVLGDHAMAGSPFTRMPQREKLDDEPRGTDANSCRALKNGGLGRYEISSGALCLGRTSSME